MKKVKVKFVIAQQQNIMESAKEKEIEEDYLSSLMDLNVNSKPLINMLTMLAEDHIAHAHVIVKAVEKHLAKVFTHF